MFKHSLIYTLRIWLGSIVVSPIVYYFWSHNYSESLSAGNFFGFWALSIIYGLILSLPCYALFLTATFYLSTTRLGSLGTKIGLGLWAAVLIIALMYLLFGHDDKVFLESTITLTASYMLSVTCAILFLQLPSKNAVRG